MADDSDLGFRLIPGFELSRPIGRGRMGVAVLATQLSLDRLVVIKFLGGDAAIDPIEHSARFRHEAQLMARIAHPHVATVFDFGIVDSYPYLVMEYVEGGDLRQHMKGAIPWTAQRVRPLAQSLVQALACLHENRILHLDLKPENILIDRHDTPKVTDFGIAELGCRLDRGRRPERSATWPRSSSIDSMWMRGPISTRWPPSVTSS